jgi:hypothetical protein
MISFSLLKTTNLSGSSGGGSMLLSSSLLDYENEREEEAMINKIVDDLLQDETASSIAQKKSASSSSSKSPKASSLKQQELEERIRELEREQQEFESHFESTGEHFLATDDFETSSTKTSVVTVKDREKDAETSSHNSLLELYNAKHVKAIEDHFKNLSEVSQAIKSAGLENSQLIFGIDFTISNLENGLRTFSGRSLHYCDQDIKNPYQKVIEILGKTLECFDVDGRIPAFGFGDANTKDRKVFAFEANGGFCAGFKDVLTKYNDILKDVKLSGPTNFGPLIKEAIKIVKETRQVTQNIQL